MQVMPVQLQWCEEEEEVLDQAEREFFGSSMEDLNLRREVSSTSSVKEKVVRKKQERANEIENWWLNLGVAIKENEEDLLRE